MVSHCFVFSFIIIVFNMYSYCWTDTEVAEYICEDETLPSFESFVST